MNQTFKVACEVLESHPSCLLFLPRKDPMTIIFLDPVFLRIFGVQKKRKQRQKTTKRTKTTNINQLQQQNMPKDKKNHASNSPNSFFAEQAQQTHMSIKTNKLCSKTLKKPRSKKMMGQMILSG